MEKKPGGDDEVELDEGDVEIVAKPSSLREEDLFTIAPAYRSAQAGEKEQGNQPVKLDPELVRPRSVKTWEQILMREEWAFCHVKLPNGYSIDQKEWQAFARENGFSISFMGYMFTIHKTVTTNRSVLMYLFGQLFITGFDISIRFFPQGIEFRPNKS